MVRTGASGHSERHSERQTSGQASGSGGSRTVTTRRSPSSSARAIRSAFRGRRRAVTTAWLTSWTVPAVARAAARRWTRATSLPPERSLEASATVPTRRDGRPSAAGQQSAAQPEPPLVARGLEDAELQLAVADGHVVGLHHGHQRGQVLRHGHAQQGLDLAVELVGGEAEQLQHLVVDLDAPGVHGQAERAAGQVARSPRPGLGGGREGDGLGEQFEAAAVLGVEAARVLAHGEQTAAAGGSGGSGRAASQKSPAGIGRAPGRTASSSGPSHSGRPSR